MKKSLIDKVIEPIAPAWALSRKQARFKADILDKAARRFDGSSNAPRMSGWKAPGTSANTAISGGITQLRNRSRDLTRNNPWAAKALKVISNNTVGTGITGQIVGRNKTQTKQLSELWTKFTNTTAIDFDGVLDLVGIENLTINTTAESGECLIRKVNVRPTRENPIPFKIQILEPDFIDNYKTADYNDGGYIQDGIEYDKGGRIVAYWLYDKHPGAERGIYRNDFISSRYPAKDVIHTFDKTRPGQTRGYPWGAAAVRRLKDFDDYEDAQLIRQKIASAFAAFEYDMNGTEPGATGLDAGGESDLDQLEYVQAGTIQKLGPGRDIKFTSPPGTSNYNEYSQNILRGAAASYGITYESFTNDYSNVNFSSARMAWLEMSRNVNKWQNVIMRAQFLDVLAGWFFNSCEVLGYNVDGASIKWTMPARAMIDPGKETKALKEQIRAGLTSLPRALKSMGYNPEEILNEIEESNKILDEKDITLDSDPRKLTMQGMEQQSEAQANQGDSDE